MQIRTKVLISFISLVLMLTFGVELSMHNIIQPQFKKLESEQLKKDIRSIENLIAQETDRIETLAHDWGVWDQTYQFIQDSNQEYRESNLYSNMLSDLKLDLVFMVHENGTVVWRDIIENRFVDTSFLPTSLWPVDHQFLKSSTITEQGIALTDQGPLLYGTSKITSGEDDSPQTGVLVFGRYLDEKLIQNIREHSLLPVEVGIAPSQEVSISVQFINEFQSVTQAFLPLVNNTNQQLKISIKAPRSLNIQARRTIHTVTVLTFISGLILTLALYLFLSRHILIPIGRLTDQAEAFGSDNHMANFDRVKRNDEIGKLFKTFRLMAEKILSYQRKLVEEKDNYQQASLTDQLTGLHNRRYLETVFYEDLNNQAGEQWLIIMLDLDYFKKVNDCYGHDAGDTVLQQLASILKQCARQDDHIIRYGGEEFLIAAKDLSVEDAANLAERIRSTIEQYQFGDQESHFQNTASLGLVQFRAPMLISQEDMERYISFADTALYAAKNNGRNSWVNINMTRSDMPKNHQALIRQIHSGRLNVKSSVQSQTNSIIWG